MAQWLLNHFPPNCSVLVHTLKIKTSLQGNHFCKKIEILHLTEILNGRISVNSRWWTTSLNLNGFFGYIIIGYCQSWELYCHEHGTSYSIHHKNNNGKVVSQTLLNSSGNLTQTDGKRDKEKRLQRQRQQCNTTDKYPASQRTVWKWPPC